MQHRSITFSHLTCAALFAAATLAGCKSSGSSESAKEGPKVNPAQVQALAKSPSPPANATKQSSIGKGTTAIQTANSAGDNDTSWVATLDVDGDGVAEETTLLWDDEDRILFAYAESDVPCEIGGSAVVALLIGVNAKGNSRGKSEGSGFYVAYLDATECGADVAGLYGAKFDPSGRITAAGAVVLDAANDDVMVMSTR